MVKKKKKQSKDNAKLFIKMFLYCKPFLHHTVRQTCGAEAAATGVVAACSASKSMSKRLLVDGASNCQQGKNRASYHLSMLLNVPGNYSKHVWKQHMYKIQY